MVSADHEGNDCGRREHFACLTSTQCSWNIGWEGAPGEQGIHWTAYHAGLPKDRGELNEQS